MKPLVIYHDNCADGFGAAFAAWLKLGDDAEYLPMQYGDIDTHLDYTGRDLYILDFSFPLEVMKHMLANARQVVWLDHHKTAFEMWCGTYIKGSLHTDKLGEHCLILDDNKSGAMLAWEYFHPDVEVPVLIKHIDDYDRWQFKLVGTKSFNKALWSYAPWSFAQWREQFLIYSQEYGRMIHEGSAILRAHDQNVKSVVERATMKCNLGEVAEEVGHINLLGLAANCPPHLASDVGHALATQSGTFGLLWSMGTNGQIACSLRSNGDYDVSAIAKAFGGGGHKNAAGFEVSAKKLFGWIP